MEEIGVGGGVGGVEIGGVVAENGCVADTHAEGDGIGEGHSLHAGNALEHLDEALLHGRHTIAGVAGQTQVDLGEHGVFDIETEGGVE